MLKVGMTQNQINCQSQNKNVAFGASMTKVANLTGTLGKYKGTFGSTLNNNNGNAMTFLNTAWHKIGKLIIKELNSKNYDGVRNTIHNLEKLAAKREKQGRDVEAPLIETIAACFRVQIKSNLSEGIVNKIFPKK